MNESEDAWGFAPPPFKPDAALEQLKRSLRGLGMSERGSGFELRGLRVLEFELQDAAINIRLAQRLIRTPSWDRSTLRHAGDQRKLLDEVKRRLDRWRDDD